MTTSLNDIIIKKLSVVIKLPWLENLQVEKDLALVQSEVDKILNNKDPYVEEIAKHLSRGDSKYIRPALLLLSAHFGKYKSHSLIFTAAAIELIHLASLYHDDIIDESQKRRELPSVNQKWGNSIAVWGGDLLMATALNCFATAGNKVNRIVSAAISDLWEGQMSEIESAYNLDIDENHYFSVIEKKTATLSELPCRLGSYLSRATPEVAAGLSHYGKKVGMAFQIIDDVLDAIASEEQLHKPTGVDLKEGIYTLPVIFLLKHNGRDSDKLRQILSQKKLHADQINEALEILKRNKALEYALERGRDFILQARQHIAFLPDNDSKNSLLTLTDFITERVEKCYEENRGI